MDLATSPKRRRGAALEAALLDAAWAELAELSYAGMTYEGVARRAETSRTVVYRRWPTKPDLVLAALRRFYELHPVARPDTGTLRGDVVSFLTEFNAQRGELITVFTVRLGTYFEETGTGLAELRTTLFGPLAGRTAMDPILARAHARGEIDLDAIPPRVASLPVDLLRNELLTTDGAVTPETIESIVDDVFLPLVAPRPRP